MIKILNNIKLISISIAVLFISFCSPIVDHHGHKITEDDLAKIEVGGSKFDVDDALGTPSVTALFNKPTYYYVSSKIETLAFFEPKETDRKVVAIYFDDNEFITRIANYGLKDGKIVDFITDETPATGKELSLLQQFFGNIGKFDTQQYIPGQQKL